MMKVKVKPDLTHKNREETVIVKGMYESGKLAHVTCF